MLITKYDPKKNLKILNIYSHFNYTFPIINIHPNNSTETINDKIIKNQLTKNIITINKIKLNYHYPNTKKNIQKKSFITQIKIAQKHNLPVIIHIKNSYKNLYKILNQFKNIKFIIHTFNKNLY